MKRSSTKATPSEPIIKHVIVRDMKELITLFGADFHEAVSRSAPTQIGIFDGDDERRLDGDEASRTRKNGRLPRKVGRP